LLAELSGLLSEADAGPTHRFAIRTYQFLLLLSTSVFGMPNAETAPAGLSKAASFLFDEWRGIYQTVMQSALRKHDDDARLQLRHDSCGKREEF
jgi:hypothetical protein